MKSVAFKLHLRDCLLVPGVSPTLGCSLSSEPPDTPSPDVHRRETAMVQRVGGKHKAQEPMGVRPRLAKDYCASGSDQTNRQSALLVSCVYCWRSSFCLSRLSVHSLVCRLLRRSEEVAPRTPLDSRRRGALPISRRIREGSPARMAAMEVEVDGPSVQCLFSTVYVYRKGEKIHRSEQVYIIGRGSWNTQHRHRSWLVVFSHHVHASHGHTAAMSWPLAEVGNEAPLRKESPASKTIFPARVRCDTPSYNRERMS